MGKYTNLRGKLPAHIPVDAPGNWLHRVDEWKERHADESTNEKARQFHNARADKKRLEAEIKELNAQMEALSQLLVADFEDEGVSSIKYDFGTLYIGDDVRTKVEDQEALFADLRQAGIGDVIKETVHWQTLNAMTKERLLDGEEPLDGTEATLLTTIKERKNAG